VVFVVLARASALLPDVEQHGYLAVSPDICLGVVGLGWAGAELL